MLLNAAGWDVQSIADKLDREVNLPGPTCNHLISKGIY
jgi:hypothetical protein